ncbi:hypothetical protein L2E82_40367 [Cichorium intybus]|uniref:Uncharacterized protein n=1 Tax=Cichorium intybus TaxID=13427 RepID=A0ACB9AMI4_CICIN|nr:hypothetical protein L2E82_40367 [Cichorium intybus]
MLTSLSKILSDFSLNLSINLQIRSCRVICLQSLRHKKSVIDGSGGCSDGGIAVFKREYAGTGVFLPQRYCNALPELKKNLHVRLLNYHWLSHSPKTWTPLSHKLDQTSIADLPHNMNEIMEVTAGVVGDICRDLEEKVLPWCHGILAQPLKDLSSNQLHRSIPFADFLNDDGFSETDVLGDDFKQVLEVIVDKSYGPGDEVLIRYGKFSNATLLLDFGFILPSNKYDQKRGLSLEEKQEKMLQISYDSQDFYLLKEVGKFGSRKGVTSKSVKDVVQTLVDDGFFSKDKIGTSLRNVSKKFESEVEISKKEHLEFVEQCDSLKKGREDSASW